MEDSREQRRVSENGMGFVRQAAILAAAGILSRILGFVLRIPLTNTIGDEGNGIYGDGYVIYNFFFILSSAGLPAAISKMVSERIALGKRGEAHRVFKVSLKCAAVIGFTGMLILAIGAEFFAALINNPRSHYTLLALSPTLLVVAIMAAFRGYFQGLGSTTPTAVSQLIEQIFNVIFSIVLMFAFMGMTLPVDNAYYGDNIALGAAGGQLGTGVGALAGLLFISGFYYLMQPVILRSARNRRRRSNVSDSSLATELFRVALPIIAGTAVFSFSNFVDSAMVKGRLISAGYTDSQALAYYGMYSGKFVTITTLPVSISAALATAVVPNIAMSAVLKDKKAVREKVNMAFRIAMIISVPAAVGLGVLSDPILHLVFKNSPDGAGLLMVGSVSVIFLALSQIATGILQGTNNIYVPVIAAACGVAVKIPLNYVLCAIPSINIYGAVISTIACYTVSSAINVHMAGKSSGIRLNFTSILIKPLIASVGMGLACFVIYYVCYFVVPSNTLATLASILAGIAVYAGFMLIIGGFERTDLTVMPYGKKISGYLVRKGIL